MPRIATRKRAILLVDNGSSRPGSTRRLRQLADALARRIGEPVFPVSLLHADKVPAEELDGIPADIFQPFLGRRLATGERHFLVIPLFFGLSRALTEAIPAWAAAHRETYGAFDLQLAPPLCPLPAGEPQLVEILHQNLIRASQRHGEEARCVFLVDHGSPLPEVTAVRHWLASALRERLGTTVRLSEAAMERRPGAEYDFNGARLDEALTGLAGDPANRPIFLLPLFLSAGRHAGPGGDIDEIVAAAEQRHPGLRIRQAELIGSHPGLIDILAERVLAADGASGAGSGAVGADQDSRLLGSSCDPKPAMAQ